MRKLRKMLHALLCSFGWHGDVHWSADVDYSKELRKVFGVRNFRVCGRCGTEVDEAE